jgi:hypothetical protein
MTSAEILNVLFENKANVNLNIDVTIGWVFSKNKIYHPTHDLDVLN